jgi:hypothetical protein
MSARRRPRASVWEPTEPTKPTEPTELLARAPRFVRGYKYDPSKAEKVFDSLTGVVPHFKSTNFMNAFLLAAICNSLTTWIIATSTTNIDEAITKSMKAYPPAQRRAVVWAITLVVSFASTFFILVLMKLIFGYGGGMLVSLQPGQQPGQQPSAQQPSAQQPSGRPA